MKNIAAFLFLLCLTIHIKGFSQNTYLSLHSEAYDLLDRLEAKTGVISAQVFSGLKPISRKDAVNFLETIITQIDSTHLTEADQYNIEQEISYSGEWTKNEAGALISIKPFWKIFYKKQADMFHLKTDDFFLVVNPVFSAQGLYEKATGFQGKRLMSGRGLEARGWISKRIGFYTLFSDNQEQPTSFAKRWIDKNQAVPGADYYKDDNPSFYDYMTARGYIDVSALKDKMHFSFGYDKHFIGDGDRSLLISDFSAPATFFRINTKVWKFDYQNLFLELVADFKRGTAANGGDILYPHKYAAIHSLSMNVNRWLNVGLFESVIFGNRNRFEYSYLNPIIFYRAIQRQLGDPDNANIGLSFKALPRKNVQLYGQFLLDDFHAKEMIAGNGYWANKWGLQLGVKYFDAFRIPNLDLQGELNIVRPYTYSHYDSASNYTHYNQPLAHPLGSNFVEAVAKIRYCIDKDIYINVKTIWYAKGVDTGSVNYGGDVFKNYYTATSTTGNPADWLYHHSLLSGVKVNGLYTDLCISYMYKPNVFLDFGGTYRAFQYKELGLASETSTYFYGGLRVNIGRRQYDL